MGDVIDFMLTTPIGFSINLEFIMLYTTKVLTWTHLLKMWLFPVMKSLE